MLQFRKSHQLVPKLSGIKSSFPCEKDPGCVLFCVFITHPFSRPLTIWAVIHLQKPVLAYLAKVFFTQQLCLMFSEPGTLPSALITSKQAQGLHDP